MQKKTDDTSFSSSHKALIPIVPQGVKISSNTLTFPVAFSNTLLVASFVPINGIYNIEPHITGYDKTKATTNWKSQGGYLDYTYTAFWTFIGY